MGPKDSVKLEIEVPEYLVYAINWYVRFTRLWVSDDYEEKARDALVAEAIRSYLESETDEIPLASDFIKEELRGLLGMKD